MSNTRRCRFKVKMGTFKGVLRCKCLQCVGNCNALPGEVMEADTIATFKRHQDRRINRQEKIGYNADKCAF